MIKINYESDFKLTEKTEERFADVPFEFVYTTNSGTYTASYDGHKYVNCKPNNDHSVTVIFNKHGLGVGKLKVRREFFIPDRDFSDGVYNVVSNDTTDVILVEGKTEGFDVEETFRPPYVVSEGSLIPIEVVDSLDSEASDKALSANQGRILNERINVVTTDVEEIDESIKNINETLGHANAAINENTNNITSNAEEINKTKANFEALESIVAEKAEASKVNQIEKAISDLGVKDTQLEASVNANATAILSKQPLLTGDEFKTINGENIMGKGNIELPKVEIVNDLTTGGADKALSAEMGKELKGMIPTKVSELENDEGYITELPDNIATTEDVSKAVSGKQDALTLTVKNNGNIVIGNISGQSKEFMPATPSGDPMHYAYVSAGAVYNDTNQIIQRTAPWNTEETWVKNEDGTYTYSEVPAIVQHLPNHWYLNGLGNLTNTDMNTIYGAGRLQVGLQMSNWFRSNARTTLGSLKNGGEGASFDLYYFDNDNYLEVAHISVCSSAFVGNLHRSFTGKNVKIIMPIIIFTSTQPNKALATFADATNLRQVFIKNLKTPFSFQYSPNIERRCILYMINNAEPTSAITITLHADAYARLAEDADIVAALEAKPLVTLVSA